MNQNRTPMRMVNIRMSDELIDALKAKAAEHGYDFSTHCRAQLSASLTNPVDPTKTVKKICR